MTKLPLLPTFLLLFSTVNGGPTSAAREQWGYAEVRPKAHMFWWLYRSPWRVEGSQPWPIILWLQGGPGASGVAIGNFQEIGPLDTDLKPRASTWLRVADLLFVDCPVGTGYSYVENKSLLVKTDEEAAKDLTKLLSQLFNGNRDLQKSPIYIVAESYGGRFAATLALKASDAIENGTLKAKLGGVALGDSWISPEDYVLSWGPLLRDVSRLDAVGAAAADTLAKKIKQQIEDKQYVAATSSWSSLETQISSNSNSVDFYNFLLDSEMDTLSPTAVMRSYGNYISRMRSSPDSGGSGDPMDRLMNGVIREKLKIIPPGVRWGGQSDDVFEMMNGEFMRARIEEVDKLLARGLNLTIYNGQLDVICSTKGTEAWLSKLRWGGMADFQRSEKRALYCGGDRRTRGFTKSFQNLRFYWILGAGHFVPVDQPCVALDMLRSITQSPAVRPPTKGGHSHSHANLSASGRR